MLYCYSLLFIKVVKNEMKRGFSALCGQRFAGNLQCSPYITLCLGSTEMEHVLSEPCYKGTVLQRDNRNFMVIFPIIPL